MAFTVARVISLSSSILLWMKAVVIL